MVDRLSRSLRQQIRHRSSSALHERGSERYNNQATGTIRGQDVVVDIKDQIRTHFWFWFEEERFTSDLVSANELTGNRPGADVLSGETPTPISVALRSEDSDRYIFYTEQTSTVRMDLTDSDAPLTAGAVDTRRPYEEIDIGSLTPEAFTWNAPRTSDWVIAVSDN